MEFKCHVCAEGATSRRSWIWLGSWHWSHHNFSKRCQISVTKWSKTSSRDSGMTIGPIIPSIQTKLIGEKYTHYTNAQMRINFVHGLHNRNWIADKLLSLRSWFDSMTWKIRKISQYIDWGWETIAVINVRNFSGCEKKFWKTKIGWNDIWALW